MKDNNLEFEGLSLEEIMKEFGGTDDLLDPAEEAQLSDLGDTKDLLDVIEQIGQPEPQQED